ncbi:MAG TPA: DinB family protein [Vicinamibacterales bacterium]|nr:DinB family protein [Vicinamibacterales bacterium]
MSEVALIVDELERGYAGDAWHGDPVTKILDGVTADMAARRPLPHAHSIWELVLHMAGWKREVAARMRGKPASDPAEGDWPAAPTGAAASEQAWRAALQALAAAHRELVDTVRGLPPDRLHAPVNDPRNRPLGTGESHAVTLHGIAQHDAYHAGQISLLKKGA